MFLFEYFGFYVGEIEVIGLVKRFNVVVILDDLKVRKVVRFEGLWVMGMVVVLCLFKDVGFIMEKNGELL